MGSRPLTGDNTAIGHAHVELFSAMTCHHELARAGFVANPVRLPTHESIVSLSRGAAEVVTAVPARCDRVDKRETRLEQEEESSRVFKLALQGL